LTNQNSKSNFIGLSPYRNQLNIDEINIDFDNIVIIKDLVGLNHLTFSDEFDLQKLSKISTNQFTPDRTG